MPTTLSIKNAPDEVVARLKQRAAKNHRSLQGELLAIIESATEPKFLTPMEILAEARRLGQSSSDSSVDIIRAARDRDNSRY